MTLVEQLKAIKNQRGRAEAHPYDQIPCNETSDKEKLCKNPVVSIMVLAYNHDKYIRECLDSLVSQIADFEYEIVIGDDCSTDSTREICFEYQRRFPGKVRVLWSEENLYSYAGNELRVRYKCRGEYVTYCEGDDYYIDNHKLQKQVDLIRKTDAVMCVAFTDWVYSDHVVHSTYYPPAYNKSSGEPIILTVEDFKRHYFHTTTYMMRRDAFMALDTIYPRFVGLRSMQVAFCMAYQGKVCLLSEIVTAYRWTGTGEATSLNVFRAICFNITAMFELYCHGPDELKPYSAREIVNKLDAIFMIRRHFTPLILAKYEIKDIWDARRDFLKMAVTDFRMTMTYRILYVLRVGLYFIESAVFKIWIKFKKV